jgi:hypothetical protein
MLGVEVNDFAPRWQRLVGLALLAAHEVVEAQQRAGRRNGVGARGEIKRDELGAVVSRSRMRRRMSAIRFWRFWRSIAGSGGASAYRRSGQNLGRDRSAGAGSHAGGAGGPSSG